LVFRNQIETGARNLWLIATMLIVLGVVLEVADRLAKRADRRTIEQVRLRDGILVGLAQALALIPGVSRSGSTIPMGLFLGMTRPTAARFSCFLSSPAVVMAAACEMRELVEGGGAGLGPTLGAAAAAFVVGYASLAWLLGYVSTRSFLPFVVYRIGLGSVL